MADKIEKASDTEIKITKTIVQEKVISMKLLSLQLDGLVKQKADIESRISEMKAQIDQASSLGVKLAAVKAQSAEAVKSN